MPNVKSNEREFMSQVIVWLNEFINAGTYPFELASAEPSIKIEDKKTDFPDVQIWLNRQAHQGFCGWELKTPTTHIDDAQLLSNAAEKARAMNADYFVTWNMRETVIWRTPLPQMFVTAQERFKSYPPLYQINVPDDLWVAPNKILLKNRAKEILDDLKTLKIEGHLHLVDIDSTYFVGRLSAAVTSIFPHMQQSLAKKVSTDTKFKTGLFAWAVKQGIANYDSPSFHETVSRQIVYRLLARIIFYMTIKRQWSNLPQLNISGLDSDAANLKLKEIFANARLIDWQSVFEEDFPDTLALSSSAIDEIDKLIRDLTRFNFSLMPQDVIGAVFEKLIPAEERHSLGQYFTPENLVDLIVAFCVRTVNDNVLDPTCGTGTFLTRSYNKMKTAGQYEHKKLLSQIWGVDLSRFPAQLATINLFKQDLSDFANFPRIVSKDFFEITPGQTFKFPPPKIAPGSTFQSVDEAAPVFDAAVGNFPYIRQELIEKRIKGNKAKLEKILKEEWLSDYPDIFIIKQDQLTAYKNGAKIDFSKVGFRLSGQADIYAYLFLHTARFIKEGGRMGFVTSNSWLDVAYGYELQKFFLTNFKIVAILESRAEPWFQDASINTVVTILERCSNKTEIENNMVKFVKIKKKLDDLIPWDMKLDAVKRWDGLYGKTYKIESAGEGNFEIKNSTMINTLVGLGTFEDTDFRIRYIKQGELQTTILAQSKTDKWGKYLRAPEVYFDILEKCGDKLISLKDVAEIKFGIKTGINDFFYLTTEKVKYWGIEQ